MQRALVDAVHVISLTPPQFRVAERAMRAAGFVDVRHFRAVRGRTVDLMDARLVSAHARYCIRRGRATGADLPSAAAIGCYLSHLRLWQALAGLGGDGGAAAALPAPLEPHEVALICEDDARWRSSTAADDLRELIGELDAAGAAWDVLQLGGTRLQHEPTTARGGALLPRRIRRVTDRFFGTEAYVVSAHGAAELCRGALPIYMQVDAYMGMHVFLGDITMLAPRPSMAYQELHFSSVQRSDADLLREELARGGGEDYEAADATTACGTSARQGGEDGGGGGRAPGDTASGAAAAIAAVLIGLVILCLLLAVAAGAAAGVAARASGEPRACTPPRLARAERAERLTRGN